MVRPITLPSIVVLLLAVGFGLSVEAQSYEPGEEGLATFERLGLQPPAPAPDRPPGEGQGPFRRFVLRGATLIDGTGAPPIGPVDIVIENDRIASVHSVGAPRTPINLRGRPAEGDFEIDAEGLYVLPGFVDSHAHIGNALQGLTGPLTPPEYVLKLWLAHGITTAREVGADMGLGWTLEHKRRSAANEITAPRLVVYARFPGSLGAGALATPEAARSWTRRVQERGADGIKFGGGSPEILQAVFDEAEKIGLRTAFHHAQMSVTRIHVLTSAGWGLDSMEHWYGLPEALFDGRTVQDYPLDYNYNDEQDRFREAGRLWRQAAEPGSEKWNEVLDQLLTLDLTLDPTFSIYEANRDVMRARRAEWHDDYTLPGLWRFFQPNPEAHGSYHFDWTTRDEINWKNNFNRWMAFVNDYKNRGGRVTVGSDAGFSFKLFGFAYIRELELLQEAGFHPLEVLRAATLNGAELAGLADEIGTVEAGKKADLVVVEENPLQNFKVLYGTGHLRLNRSTQELERVGGVLYTIKDGIVYDAKQLLADVRAMVREAKALEASHPWPGPSSEAKDQRQ